MGTERIDIIVSERGSRVVKRRLEDIGRGAQRAQSHLRKMTLALQTLALGGGAAVLTNLLDTFTLMQNRLRNVTDSTTELNAVTERLFEISNQTRSSFETSTTVFARTALAVRDLGISEGEVLQFTKSLNQAIILSGVNAAEATGAMIQLSQGMASGTLRGDELRSVLEQLPAVADVISDRMGVTRGELRELGFEGKITTDIILAAFKDARQELEDRFAKTVPTIGQSFTVLRNRVIQMIGTFNNSTGALQLISRAIFFLGDNIETVTRLIGALAIVIGGSLFIKAVRGAYGAVNLFFKSFKKTPLKTFGGLLGGLIALLITFGDQIVVSASQGTTAMDLLAVAFEDLKSVASRAVSSLDDLLDGLASDILSIDVTFRDLVRTSAGVFSILPAFVNGVNKATQALLNNLKTQLVPALLDFYNDMIRRTAKFVGELLDALGPLGRKLREEFLSEGELFQFDTESMRGQAQSVGEAFLQGFKEVFNNDPIVKYIDSLFDRGAERAKARIERQLKEARERAEALAALFNKGQDKRKTTEQQKPFLDVVRGLKEEATLLSQTNRERERTAQLFTIVNSLKEQGIDLDLKQNEGLRQRLELMIGANQRLAEESAILDEIKGPQEQFEANLAAINKLLEEGEINADEYNKKLRGMQLELLQTKTDAVSGLKRGLLEIQRASEDIGSDIENFTVKTFNGMSDALAEFVTTGKLDFKSFVNSIIADLTRIATQRVLFSLIGGGIPGFAHGGSFTVGGSGGTDSQLVQFAATPGERVTVETPAQQRRDGEPVQQIINQSFNFYGNTNVDEFKRSQPQIQVRAAAGARRAMQRRGA